MTDHNCFVGNWPFYRLDNADLGSLIEEHAACGIDHGYVSSLQSIFYNDFYEAEEELGRMIGNSGYFHTVIPNPTVQCYEHALKRCFDEFDVRGIRLVPGYQGYSLEHGGLELVKRYAGERNIPIFINARMTDERMTHMITPEIPTVKELADFVRSAPDIKVVLCYLKENEAEGVYDLCRDSENLWFDTAGMTSSLVLGEFPKYIGKTVLGTGFPLRSVKATALRMESEIGK